MSPKNRALELNGRRYHRGQVVEAVVRKVFPFGVLVELADGTQGLIRKREISWNASLSDEELYQTVSVGKRISPVVLEMDTKYKRLVLSLRRAHYDPWDIIEEQAEELVGYVVRGSVESVKPYGAFIKLEDPRGAVGLVHISRIPGSEKREVKDLLWIGDQVEAVIKRIDLSDQQIGLSINERLSRGRVLEETKRYLPVSDEEYAELDAIDNDGMRNIVVRRRGVIDRIIIIDDNEEFCEAFCDSLRAAGYKAEGFTDWHQGIEEAIGTKYDLIFLDINLGDTSGFEVAKEIHSSRPEARITLITGLNLPVDEPYISELDLVEVVYKTDCHQPG
jgi:predicted RNA-binding protein with RPS1 domain